MDDEIDAKFKRALRALTLLLVKDCCDGSPEVCGPLAAEFAACG